MIKLLRASKFGMAKVQCSYIQNGQVKTFEGTIYFAVDGTCSN